MEENIKRHSWPAFTTAANGAQAPIMKKIAVIVICIILASIYIYNYDYAHAQGEQITLSTYYPAPYGEYQSLAVGDSYTAPDPGSATEEVLVVEGNVYIGTDNTNGTITDPNIGLVVEGGAISHAENNTFFGNQVATHINLGIGSMTGDPSPGSNNPYCTVGGGLSNRAHGNYSTVSGGDNSRAIAHYSTVSGGRDNRAAAYSSAVGGGHHNTAYGNYTTVGGGYYNTAYGNYTTVGGGYYNTANGENSTVGGGRYNRANGSYSIVGGGYNQTANGTYSTIVGGYHNTAGGSYAVVVGGYNSTANGSYATVSGGIFNTANGNYATVSGGSDNTAWGDYSWPGGCNMRLSSSADRTFVWGYSDSAAASTVTASDAFLIFPYGNPGKVGIGTRDPAHAFELHIDTSGLSPTPSGGITVENIDPNGNVFVNARNSNSWPSDFCITKASEGFVYGNLDFEGSGGLFNGDNTPIRFFTDGYNYAAANNLAGAQKMIITGNGRVGIGTGDPDYKLDVRENRGGGFAAYFHNEGGSSIRRGIRIQAGSSTSGTLVRFYNGAGSYIGNINFTGGTVDYNPFTGSHPAAIPEKDNDAGYDYGTVVCVIKVNSNAESYQPAYYVEPCEQPNDPGVFGVYAPGDNEELEEESEDDIDNQHTIFALGDGHVLVTNINGEINRGDYVTSSPVRGHGQRQDDDIMHNYTVAKIMEQIDWEKVTETIEYNGRKYKKALLACIYHSG